MLQVNEDRQSEKGPQGAAEGFPGWVEETVLYTRYEHGNLPVRVLRDGDGRRVYEMATPSDDPGGRRVELHRSRRALMRAVYGTDNHIPFARYFRLGRYRRVAEDGANILTLLDAGEARTRRTDVVVRVEAPRKVVPAVPDPEVLEVVEALEGDKLPPEAFEEATEERMRGFDKAFALELDRLEGLVGIDLGAKSERRDTVWRADEVRKLLWRGFAGKMLSQGYDPDDVLQEVYRGLLVRNEGKCPWDGRKSTFGHYVHMVIGCVLTNYHRKQVRRVDKDAVSMDAGREGDDGMPDMGRWGSVNIESGSEVGEEMAVGGLAEWLEGLEDDGPEARLGREIMPLVAAGMGRGEIVEKTGRKPSLVSRALAWLRRKTAEWAKSGGHGELVPERYRGE